MNVAAIVLTLNEKPRIEECLKHLKPHVDFLLVLDGGSTDGTIEIGKQYTDRIEVKPFSNSFGEERNHAQSLLPFWCEWALHADVDEIFPEEFLKRMKEIIAKSDAVSFRFPRISLVTEEEARNLPKSRLTNTPYGLAKDYPDRQVRLVKVTEVEWKGKTHEVPYSILKDKPIVEVSCITFGEDPKYPTYTIIHLPRRTDEVRPWW